MSRPCVVDTSIVLSFTGIGRLEILLDNRRYDWCITPLVRGDLTRREYRDPVDAAIAAARLRVTAIDGSNGMELLAWSQWTAVVDPTEAEIISIALCRDWLVAIDDRHAQRAIEESLSPGRWLNSVNMLMDAVRDRRLSTGEADALFRTLDCYRGYAKRAITSLMQALST